MNAIFEIVGFLLKFIYFVLEGIVFFFIPRPKKEIKGQVALVTGAGSGIGRLISLRLAKLGCIQVLVDIDEKAIEKTAAEIRELGGHCYNYRCDLSRRQEVYETVDKVKKEVGDIDILVNNAGIVSGRSLLELSDSQIERTFDVNALAHFWLIRGFLPSMYSRNQGHIVNIVSIAGFFGLNRMTDYCSSKFAALGFNESLIEEIRENNKFGVKMTCICPFFINTGMFDGVTLRYSCLLPMLKPEYVADKTIQGLLTDQRLVMIPRMMYFMAFIKHLVPCKAYELVQEVLHTEEIMTSFIGRVHNK